MALKAIVNSGGFFSPEDCSFLPLICKGHFLILFAE